MTGLKSWDVPSQLLLTLPVSTQSMVWGLTSLPVGGLWGQRWHRIVAASL